MSLRTTVILGIVRQAAATGADAGAGLCMELQDDTPSSIGLVQFHAAKAAPLQLAMRRRGAAGGSAQLSEAQSAALTATLPAVFHNYYGEVAAQGFVTVLNNSLSAFESQADTLLERCAEYRTNIVSSINATISEKFGDGVGQLQAMVDARLVPISGTWTGIVKSFQAIGPPVIEGMKGLKLTTTAASADKAFANLMSTARSVSGLLGNSTATIGNLSNATREEKESALQELDAALDDGMVTVANLKDNLVLLMTHLLTGLTTRLSEHSNITVKPVQSKVDALAGKLEDSLDMALSGTHEAADLAVRAAQWSAAAPLRAWLGLALAAACAGASQALGP